MKKVMYALILPLVVVGGLVFANCEIKNETSKKATPELLSATEVKAEREKWEATPDGIKHKEWETSPEGMKILASAAKIRRHISDSTAMEAVITSLSLPPGARLGFGMMARINDAYYILSFGTEKPNEFEQSHDVFGPQKPNGFQQLRSLKVNDKITIRSGSVSYAPKYAYPIISGDYVERDGKVIYKRAPRKGGC